MISFERLNIDHATITSEIHHQDFDDHFASLMALAMSVTFPGVDLAHNQLLATSPTVTTKREKDCIRICTPKVLYGFQQVYHTHPRHGTCRGHVRGLCNDRSYSSLPGKPCHSCIRNPTACLDHKLCNIPLAERSTGFCRNNSCPRVERCMTMGPLALQTRVTWVGLLHPLAYRSRISHDHLLCCWWKNTGILTMLEHRQWPSQQ